MKLIKYISKTKKVMYFDVEIEVPLSTKYIGTDHNGWCWTHFEKPDLNEISGQWESETYFTHVANFDLNGTDWKDTLREI